jgi:hypothetical protein
MDKQQCPEFPHFGARYPDARCIDGYLWDLDSDNDGMFTRGGDDPCPFCNTEQYIEFLLDEHNGVTRSQIEQHIQQLRNRYQHPD